MLKKVVFLAVLAFLAGGAAWYFLLAKPNEKAAARARLNQMSREAQSLGYDARHQAKKLIDTSAPSGNPLQDALDCRNTLKRIETAKRQAAENLGIAAGMVPPGEVLKIMGATELPRCPAGGQYIIGPVGAVARCTIGGNNTATIEDDHVIANF